MNSSQPLPRSLPFHSKEGKNVKFIAFWSKKVNAFVNKIYDSATYAHATHHDLLVNFINKEYLGGAGKINHKKRVKGSTHDDLTTSSEVIEFKFHSNALESLTIVLKNMRQIFERNDYIYFSYFRERGQKDKDKTKIIKTRNCMFYLIVVIIPKKVKSLNLKVLLNEIIKEEMEFTKEVSLKSGVDLDEEELYAVGNMIKVRKLEQALEEKDKALEEKERELQRLKSQSKAKKVN